MQTAAAYIRVSTDDQIEYSPDSQIKKIREYAASHDILMPEEFVFLDEGISGRNAEKRPSFMKMIGTAKMKPRPFDIILLWKFSRFARNRQDSILYKSMLRKECGVDVVSITEQLADDPTAILIEALLEAMDEYYSINLAQEVKRGMNEKFSRGGVVSVPPFGYKMGTEHYEIDEETAPFVRMIYEDFLNGIPYRQIAAKLNDLGIRSIRGNLFENRTVEYILSNPTYLGKLRRNPNGIDRTDRYHRGDDVIIVDAKHKPILSVETYKAVQERITVIKKAHPKHARTSYADFMLRGLMRCSNCGSTLTQAVKGKSLQCHKYARGQCCESHNISLEKLNRAVLLKLGTDTQGEELEIKVSEVKETVTPDVSQTLLEKEYKRLERVKAAYEAGIDSLEEYRLNKANISERIAALEKKITRPVLFKEQITKTFKKRLKEAIPILKSPEISEADKNELLRSFVSQIVFRRAEETIQIYYYI